MNAQVLLYPILVLVLTIFLLITVPRGALRSLIPYGLALGGLFDFIWHWLFGHVLGLFAFKNLGIFDFNGHVFLAPLAWTLIIVFYLYFWPREGTKLAYLYVLTWALLATGFGQVVNGVGMFEYEPWVYPFPMLILFLGRFALVAWIAKPWTNSWS